MLAGCQGQVGFDVARQVYMGFAVGKGNFIGAVPGLIGEIGVAGVIPGGDFTTADTVGVAQPQYQMECGTLLDVVIGQGLLLLQLLAGENQPLLRRRDTLSFLDLDLQSQDRVRGLHLQRNILPGKGSYCDLDASLRRCGDRYEGEHHAQGQQNAQDASFHLLSSIFRVDVLCAVGHTRQYDRFVGTTPDGPFTNKIIIYILILSYVSAGIKGKNKNRAEYFFGGE